MKLRYLIAAGIVAILIGGAIWLYDNAGEQIATGTGGLPLIKASSNPIKLPPPDDAVGEVMPHADSTVFSAISSDQDPSMQDVRMPSEGEDPNSSSDFAGFKTGFAVPSQPALKTESLFDENETKTEAKEEPRYYSGLTEAAEPVVAPIEHVQTAKEETKEEAEVVEAKPAPEPEPKIEEKAAEEKAPEPVSEPVQEPAVAITPTEEVAPVAPIVTAGDSAQDLEAQEKAMIRPAVKPQPPTSTIREDVAEEPKVAVKPEPKEEPKPVESKPAPTSLPPVREVALAPRPSVGMSPVIEEGGAPSSSGPAPASGGYVIQLSSTPSQADAERSWKRMQSLYPDEMQGLSPSYKTAEVPGKGTVVRLRAGTLSREEANARCNAIRAVDPRGGGCLVLRN